MSSGNELQEMEVGTKQSKTAVNANARPGDPLPKEGSNAAGVKTPGNTPPFEDLGGPTPDNYSPTNDSAKLKDAAGPLKQVRDVVNKGAAAADKAMPSVNKKNALPEEEQVSDESVIEEEETTTDEVEVVAEEETTEEEVVAEAPEFSRV